MPPPQIFATTGHAYGLTVSGVQLSGRVPTDLAPVRWERPGAATNGSIVFTVEDDGETGVPPGAVIRLTDNTTNTLLWSGVLTGRRFRRGPGTRRYVECSGVGWGYFLDNRAVTSYDWPASRTMLGTLLSLFAEHGGPVRAATLGMASGDMAAGEVRKATLRAAVEQIIGDATSVQTYMSGLGIFDNSTTTESPPVRYLVDDDAVLHTYYLGRTDLPNAPSVGSDGDLVPEYLSHDIGSEGTAHLAHAYGTDGTNEGIAANSQAAGWDAGTTTVIYDSDLRTGAGVVVEAEGRLRSHAGDIESLSFSTDEQGGWAPGQRLELDDGVLGTGTFYIEAVSGTLAAHNVVTYHVTTGAPAWSLAQSVTGLAESVITG